MTVHITYPPRLTWGPLLSVLLMYDGLHMMSSILSSFLRWLLPVWPLLLHPLWHHFDKEVGDGLASHKRIQFQALSVV